ncbi:caspase domain-containing protein [Armillaria borealis]|uniref:Caspase domain-containing protein n=1 Tax=Armillaria borealis TaxID=47425 RepID=A0AA39ML38_9AGAR|nr:caspase domain-containing protein [Armillaria borealis]
MAIFVGDSQDPTGSICPSDALVVSGVSLPGTPPSLESPIINPPGASHPNETSTLVHNEDAELTDEIKNVKERIVCYEMQEVDIVKKYGMPGNIDSATILQTVKDMVCDSADPQYSLEIVRDAELLDALLKERCRLEHLQEPGPRLPNSSEQLPNPRDPEPLNPDRSWSIIIGINAYQASPLRGCVSDALDVYQYLVHVLGVPESHIQLLLAPCGGPSPDTPFPSRANIIEALHSLHRNPLIQKGDNIIIYFSGHGASYRCSDYFPKRESGTAHTGAVEAICPADRTVDMNGHPLIPDISDRELNTILHLVRVKKGENITVITDCCYASGVTRGVSSSFQHNTTRNLPPLLASGLELMLQTGDENLREFYLPGTVSVLAENWSPLNASHVLLAACREYQFAREVQKDDGTVNGVFTEALMSALRSGLHNQSYHDLCCTISAATPLQTPIAIGENKDKLFPWYPRV